MLRWALRKPSLWEKSLVEFDTDCSRMLGGVEDEAGVVAVFWMRFPFSKHLPVFEQLSFKSS